MNGTTLDYTEGRVFAEFEYRLLYLRPSPYSDERIAIGVASAHPGKLDLRFVASVGAMEMLSRLFGDESVEQYHFAAAELKRAARTIGSLDEIEMPTDLFVAGEKMVAVTEDREGLLSSVLTSSSCLLRPSAAKTSEILSTTTAVGWQKDLFEQVGLLNPFLGDRIFNRKFTADNGEVVRLPILGERIFGATVSFAAKDQSTAAEAYLAKFHWLRGQMSQQPRIYVLAPQNSRGESPSRGSGIRELRSIAEALDVPMEISETTKVMAAQILKAEAA